MLETELSFIRQELSKLRDGDGDTGPVISIQEEPVQKDKKTAGEVLSSPRWGFPALIIAVIALLAG